MSIHLNIIVRSNGVGLDRDANLLKKITESSGYRVTVNHCRSIPIWNRWLPSKKRYDANIFLERIFPRWLGSARLNLLIPNQERFPRRHIPRLGKIDHVLCKSQHALEIFSKLHPSCRFTGFTSEDLNDPKIARKQNAILHLAGRSTLKGTETVLELWKKHPKWPTLTLLQHEDNAPADVPSNVNLITDYISDEGIIKLVNEHPIHLCPSLSEGWGHYIVEAMSCGATVITTEGPPMNELVQADRGILVSAPETEPRHLGTNFKVAHSALESAIEQAISMSKEDRTSMQAKAQNWMQQNHRNFDARLTDFLSSL